MQSPCTPGSHTPTGTYKSVWDVAMTGNGNLLYKADPGYSQSNYQLGIVGKTSLVQSVGFHNNGLYNIDASGAYPPENTGLYDLTGERRDMGRFKAPTLRNIALMVPLPVAPATGWTMSTS